MITCPAFRYPSPHIMCLRCHAVKSLVSQVAVLANQSDNHLVRDATVKLVTLGWPNELIIFQSYYLQNVLYTDAIPGITWYIVVLLPAVIERDHVSSSSKYYWVVFAMALVAVLINCFGLCLLFMLRRAKMVKMTQPMFTFIILLGDILLAVTVICLLGKNTSTSCVARLYMFNASFSITFAPLLVKGWKVHYVFNINPMKRKALISAAKLIAVTLLFVVLDVSLVSICSYGIGRSPEPVDSLEYTSAGAYAQLTYCGYHKNNILFVVELAYKGFLILLACYFAFKVRRVVGVIAGSKTLLGIVYNAAFVCVVIIVITRSVTDIDTVVLCEAVGICFCTVVNCVGIIAPVVYHHFIVGDEAAADNALEGLTSSSQLKAPSVISFQNVHRSRFFTSFKVETPHSDRYRGNKSVAVDE